MKIDGTLNVTNDIQHNGVSILNGGGGTKLYKHSVTFYTEEEQDNVTFVIISSYSQDLSANFQDTISMFDYLSSNGLIVNILLGNTSWISFKRDTTHYCLLSGTYNTKQSSYNTWFYTIDSTDIVSDIVTEL